MIKKECYQRLMRKNGHECSYGRKKAKQERRCGQKRYEGEKGGGGGGGNIHAMKGKFRVHMESYIPRNGIGVTRLRSRGCLSTKEAGYSDNVKWHCREKTK
jgi:hypothetical protein